MSAARALAQLRPDVLYLGFPKCGTTSIAAWLGLQDAVATSEPKETFALVPQFGRRPRVIGPSPFAAGEQRLRVEATTLNVYSAELPELVAKTDIRVMLSIREPRAVLPSWHNQMERAGLTGGRTLDELWSSTPVSNQTPDYLRAYRSVLSYGSHLQRWLDAVGPQRLLTIDAAELTEDVAGLSDRMGRFLGINFNNYPVPRANTYQEVRFARIFALMKRSRTVARMRHLAGRAGVSDARLKRGLITLFASGSQGPVQRIDLTDDLADDWRQAQALHEDNRRLWTPS